jgi:hypothetical protein
MKLSAHWREFLCFSIRFSSGFMKIKRHQASKNHQSQPSKCVLWRQHHYSALFCNSKWKIVAYIFFLLFPRDFTLLSFFFSQIWNNKTMEWEVPTSLRARELKLKEEENIKKKFLKHIARVGNFMVWLSNSCLSF